jgi:hypothetical protein
VAGIGVTICTCNVLFAGVVDTTAPDGTFNKGFMISTTATVPIVAGSFLVSFCAAVCATAVPVTVGTAVRVAVGTAVRVAVGTAVPVAVGTAVPVAVGTAVPVAVGTAVPVAVGAIVTSMAFDASGNVSRSDGAVCFSTGVCDEERFTKEDVKKEEDDEEDEQKDDGGSTTLANVVSHVGATFRLHSVESDFFATLS